MGYAPTFYTGNGTQKVFTIDWNYVAVSHVKVRVAGIDMTSGYSVSGNSVTFDTAPSNGASVEIYRQTPLDTIQDFIRGGTPSSGGFNTVLTRVQYIAQEAAYAILGSLRKDVDDAWDAQTSRIKNISPGVASSDAATLGQIQSVATNGLIPDGTSKGGHYLRERMDGLGLEFRSSEDVRDDLNLGDLAILNSVGSAQIDDSAITTGKLADGSVTVGKIASDSVDTTHLKDKSVTPAKISATVLRSGQMVGLPPEYKNANTITCYAGLTVRSGDDTEEITLGADTDVSLTSNGANGLDTGSKANNTWYYLWLCKGVSGVCALFSTSLTAPTLPSGYDLVKGRVKNFAVRVNGSGNIVPFMVGAGWPSRPKIHYSVTTTNTPNLTTGDTTVLSGGTASSFASVSCSSWVPPISRLAVINWVTQNSADKVWLRTDSSLLNGVFSFGYSLSRIIEMPLSASLTFEYRRAEGTGTQWADVVGWVGTEDI